MQQQIQEIQSKLSKKLSEKRFTHTIGVLYTAEALAMRYGEDLDKAAYAAVLHDCAKYCSGEQMLQKCRKYNIEISEVEQKNPSLMQNLESIMRNIVTKLMMSRYWQQFAGIRQEDRR